MIVRIIRKAEIRLEFVVGQDVSATVIGDPAGKPIRGAVDVG